MLRDPTSLRIRAEAITVYLCIIFMGLFALFRDGTVPVAIMFDAFTKLALAAIGAITTYGAIDRYVDMRKALSSNDTETRKTVSNNEAVTRLNGVTSSGHTGTTGNTPPPMSSMPSTTDRPVA